MTDVVYNHSLPLKEFAVSDAAFRTWLDANLTTPFSGYSKGYDVQVHFKGVPTEDETTALNLYWDSLVDGVDAEAELAKARFLMIEETKIQYGIKVKAYLGYLCEVEGFGPTEYGQLLTDADLSLANLLLLNGALETVKGIVDSYVVTLYFTQGMKDALSAELQKYITLVASL